MRPAVPAHTDDQGHPECPERVLAHEPEWVLRPLANAQLGCHECDAPDDEAQEYATECYRQDCVLEIGTNRELNFRVVHDTPLSGLRV